MVPRTSVVAIGRDATLQDLLQEVADSGHSRYPVMGESLDEIVGLVEFKDLAEPLSAGVLKLDQSIQPWIRRAEAVSEEMPLNELLELMRQSGQTMVIVVDNFGGTAGLVTIQDVVAEIIGETREPESPEEPAIQQIDEQTYLVQAQTDLEEVNEIIGMQLPLSEEYQTLGGFVIYQMQKIPKIDEFFHYENWEIRVKLAEGPRLERIQIRRDLPSEEPTELPADDEPTPDAWDNRPSTDNLPPWTHRNNGNASPPPPDDTHSPRRIWPPDADSPDS